VNGFEDRLAPPPSKPAGELRLSHFRRACNATLKTVITAQAVTHTTVTNIVIHSFAMSHAEARLF
jgi:hypothetical protein